MQVNQIPFNIHLLHLETNDLKNMAPLTAMDIFDGATKNFHPGGLFSTEIFGKVGTEVRNRRFAYIKLKVSVLHPVVYKSLCSMKHLYGEIMAGTGFAIWNKEIKDFEKSNILDGETGYDFFMSHFFDIKFEKRNSPKRDFAIDMIEKYGEKCLMDYLIVMPAGIRDFEFDESGKPSEDLVNDLYRKVMALSNLIPATISKDSLAAVNNTRNSIQKAVVDIYEYIISLCDGKHKLILGKFATRAIFNGTRNVITSMINECDQLNSPKVIKFNQTVCGLYQFAKSILPVTINKLRNGHLSKVFVGSNSPAILTNKKTLRREMVNLNAAIYDEWMTDEGIEKIITRFEEEDIRHNPLELKDHYFGLMYRGPDMTFKIFQDIDELPKECSREHVTPLTFCELIYCSLYEGADKYPAFFTRYPVAGFGSIYPTQIYLKSTIKSEMRYELNDQWEKTDKIAIQFPIIGEPFVNSMSPHVSHLARLDAD